MTQERSILDPDTAQLLQVFFALAGLRAATTVSVKLAVLFLYKQVFTLDDLRFRIAWWACFLYLVPCFMTVDLAFYGVIFANKRMPHLPLADFRLGQIAHMVTAWLNTVADMSVLLLPLPYLVKLRIHRSQKAALWVLLLMGFLATAGTWANAIVLSVAFAEGCVLSPAYANTVLLVASVVESAIGVLCACLATSKPATSSMWRSIKPILHGDKKRGESTELPHPEESPGTALGLAILSEKELVRVYTEAS
ncbi:hypothetical protein BU23DRAFT_89399 [Bimuria novae-zelandiae CBS 107.79]|uniref:Rhodopsin domain-containing protein n=1 Tax=Bimuria novae-zelandiae CBS 107.79 TaxID=1447943 RepID=A0A6A5VC87_9PLEO|nr:hypothetical protein BU23DRAFT_89399 [Bimuria novae-zelandiae CBS 107.79]